MTSKVPRTPTVCTFHCVDWCDLSTIIRCFFVEDLAALRIVTTTGDSLLAGTGVPAACLLAGTGVPADINSMICMSLRQNIVEDCWSELSKGWF